MRISSLPVKPCVFLHLPTTQTMVNMALAFILAFLGPFSTHKPNQGVVVNLRIEGEHSTIFEGPIFTKGHDVEMDASGKHRCDGTTGPNPAPYPGATCFSALDDVAKEQQFKIAGYALHCALKGGSL